VASVTDDGVVSQQILLSEKIETDFADATLRYNNSLNALQAALNASARVLQPTLLDFIR
jgi:flagellin-like hook-associated protein FlgL